MKNFGTLYGYELKKLLRRKLAWIMVLVIAALMAYTARPVSADGSGWEYRKQICLHSRAEGTGLQGKAEYQRADYG